MIRSLLLSRNLVVVDRSKPPSSEEALTRIGRDWLEECVIGNGSVEWANPQPVHGGEFTAKNGCYSPVDERTAVVGQLSLWNLVDDPTADHAIRTNPLEVGTRGYMDPPPDVWLGPPPLQLLSAELLNTSVVAWSPAGDRLAFSSFGGPLGTVVTVLGEGRVRYRFWDTVESDLLAWSPDGSELWLVDNGNPLVLHLGDGCIRSTMLESGCQGIAWSADGEALAATQSGGLTILRADGSRERHQVGAAWTPLWLDEDHVLFNSRDGIDSPEGWDLEGIRMLRLADGHVETVVHPLEIEEGIVSVPRRPCAVRRDLHVEKRWWDDLINDDSATAPSFPDVPPLDDGFTRIRDNKLRLMQASQPGLYERYSQEWVA